MQIKIDALLEVVDVPEWRRQAMVGLVLPVVEQTDMGFVVASQAIASGFVANNNFAMAEFWADSQVSHILVSFGKCSPV